MKSKKISILLLIVGMAVLSCSDPNIIGLEVQPPSDKIVITNSEIPSFSIVTLSEDSLRSDETANLMLGGLNNDPIFPSSKSSFLTQILLPANNIELGDISEIIIDSVILNYTYSGYYGDHMTEFEHIIVAELGESIYKDSSYYSNWEIINDPNLTQNNLAIGHSISSDTSSNPHLKIYLDNTIGQYLIDGVNGGHLLDNSTFLEYFNGLYVATGINENMILYLNPGGMNSQFSIYYHNINNQDSSMNLSFILDGDAARINLFNEKDLSSIIVEENKTYIQSMAGYKALFILNNIDSLKDFFQNKAINQVKLNFEIIEDVNYPPHEKLLLYRENYNGNMVYLTDFTIEGDSHFGGSISNNTYSFNISRYFYQLLNNSLYDNKLYLVPSGGPVNASRTIIDNDKINISVIYSEL